MFELFLNEANDLNKEFANLSIIDEDGIPCLKGDIDIIDINNKYWETYTIQVKCSKQYPERFPIVFEVSNKIPKIDDWHINDDHSCCIRVLQEELIICSNGITLNDFLKNQVKPYFFNQTHRRKLGYYVNGEYSHGLGGIIEFYAQKLNTLDNKEILKLLLFIQREKEPIRVADCFCGSNKKYRKCHREAFRVLSKIGKEQLATDIHNIYNYMYRIENFQNA